MVQALEELEVGRGLLGGEKKSLAFHAKDFLTDKQKSFAEISSLGGGC